MNPFNRLVTVGPAITCASGETKEAALIWPGAAYPIQLLKIEM